MKYGWDLQITPEHFIHLMSTLSIDSLFFTFVLVYTRNV